MCPSLGHTRKKLSPLAISSSSPMTKSSPSRIGKALRYRYCSHSSYTHSILYTPQMNTCARLWCAFGSHNRIVATKHTFGGLLLQPNYPSIPVELDQTMHNNCIPNPPDLLFGGWGPLQPRVSLETGSHGELDLQQRAGVHRRVSVQPWCNYSPLRMDGPAL